MAGAVIERSARALEVEFAGCHVVYAGPRCELTQAARTLTLWVATESPLHAASDGVDLSLEEARALAGGRQYRITIPRGVQRLTLVAPDTGARFELALGEAVSAPLLEEAASLRARGDGEGARARLEHGLSGLAPELQERAKALLARIALSQGNHAVAAEGLRASMNAALTRGRISDAVLDATALAYVLCMNLHRYADAREVLRGVERASLQDPGSRALLPQYEGTIAIGTGDLRTGLLRFRETAERARRLGLVSHELLARQKETTALTQLGRGDEALDAQRRIIADFPKGDSCRAVDVRDQLLWLAILMQLRSGDARGQEVARAGREAEEQLKKCNDPWRHRNHLINRGLFALLQAEVEEAECALRELARLERGQDAQLRAWELELRGRVALARGRGPEALDAFRSELHLSETAGLWDNEYLARLGMGQSFERLGRPRPAMAAYAEADQLMDLLLQGVPLAEGMRGFLHQRDAALQRLLVLLVHHGEAARALELARRGRARAIRLLSRETRIAQLDDASRARWEEALARYHAERNAVEGQRARAWQLPSDQLALAAEQSAAREQKALAALDAGYALLGGSAAVPPRREEPGEALLAFVPVASGLLGFGRLDGTVVARTLPAQGADATAEQRSEALLVPFRTLLLRARRLRVLLPGELNGIDLHALELDGVPLLQRYPIAYALDAERVSVSAEAPAGALVVANAASDLPAASREGEIAAQALGADTTQLLIGSAATRARVLASLAGASAFHYAGHGQYAGVEGIDSGLRLADGWLTFGDILALPAVPKWIVLSACEGAGGARSGFAGGAGVAEAFIAGGARTVIASVRPVRDRTAHALFRALYAARGAGSDEDAVAWLRDAQLQVAAEQPDLDWTSFRAIVP